MKKIFSSTVVLSLFAVCLINAQVNTKLDLRLWKQLTKGELKDGSIALLVKGDAEGVKSLVEELDGTFNYHYGNISSIVIPVKNLIRFSESKVVEKIENTHVEGRALMDTARIRNNIDSAHTGFAPLTNGLKGKGVIVGIIDGGIYWQHLDFRKPTDSSTRIRYIWDQRYFGNNKPLPYNYGYEWNWQDINSGNCAHVAPYRGDSSDFGHGTIVAGIAAGNSLSTKGTAYENQLTGVAPESEMIVVRINYENNFLANVADAVDYIFKKADALGKPCVINTSIGTYYGSHDGKDLASQMIDGMLQERNGRALVAAGGNAGNIPHHLSYSIPPDSAYTFFKYNSSTGEIYFDFWADTADFKNAYFKVGCNDTLGNDLDNTEYFNVPLNFNPAPGSGHLESRSLYTNTTNLGDVDIYVSLDEGRYHVEVLIDPVNNANYWRLQTSGSGTFDLWSSASVIGSADMTSYIKTGDINVPSIYIQYPNYRHPDTLKTLVSSWQNSDKVITVGNYCNRAGYIDSDSNYVDLTVSPYNEIVGHKAKTSSIGPTRDGRLKPDVMATGSTTISTGDGFYIPYLEDFKVYITNKHIRNGGTSMASPIVAGIAALYLEKRPTATYDEIKQALICTATKDSFTGNTANYEYGNGKVNAFAAVTSPLSCFIFGAKDTACINYNEFANADTGSCVLKVYGCMDTAADNYNPLANVSSGDCAYSVGIDLLNIGSFTVQATPNPFSNYTVFKIVGENVENGSIKIYNQLGELTNEIKTHPGKSEYTFHNSKLAKGIYYYQLNFGERNIFTGKIAVE